MFQPQNAIPITSWFDDKEDRELAALLPVLEDISKSPNILDKIANIN
jgi:RNA polymerase II subunit A small phosphatase-like protein